MALRDDEPAYASGLVTIQVWSSSGLQTWDLERRGRQEIGILSYSFVPIYAFLIVWVSRVCTVYAYALPALRAAAA